MIKLTKKQRHAVKRIYDRNSTPKIGYRTFRKQVIPGFGYVGIEWNGMFLGIEPDGYTHS